ncbi:MAG: GNAT family N-acetyltransferase [Patescibacteria group bacterium]
MIAHGFENFASVSDQWDRTAQKSERNIDKLFGSSSFLKVWYRTSLPAAEPYVLFDDDRSRTCGLPLVLSRTSRGKLLLSAPTTTEDNTWYAPVIGDADEVSGMRIAATLEESNVGDAIILQHVDMSRVFWRSFIQYFRSRKYALVVYPTIRIGNISLGEQWDVYYHSLRSDLKRSLRRKEQYLTSEFGPLTVSVAERKEEIINACYEGFAIETMGWKGYAHSAVLQQDRTKQYFFDLAKTAAEKGSIVLVSLICGGFPVSFHFMLRQGNEAYFFKTMYDEKFSCYSVGQLGVLKTLELLHRRGVRTLNFFGPYVPWHDRWKPSFVTQYSKVVISRSVNRTFAVLPYRAYAIIKKSTFAFRLFAQMRKLYNIMKILRDTFKVLVQHLR